MMDFWQSIMDGMDSVVNFVTAAPSYFEQLVTYINLWILKAYLVIKVYFIRSAYLLAVALLDEIGFNVILSELFNALPSELRYYAFLFKIPDAISIYFNCAATALVMRLMR